MKPLVTTPIFYVNAKPHIGHAYTMVLSDAIARWNQCRLTTGTDEHGLKVWNAAGGANVHSWTDKISRAFRNTAEGLSVQLSDFIRTTERRHYDKVEWFWNRLHANGMLYQGEHCGWYSAVEERFIVESEVDKYENLEYFKEVNWKFRLNLFSERINKYHAESKIVPECRRAELGTFIHEDLSVSRPIKSMKWGIPVPNDPSQLIYVWLDALINYLTVGHKDEYFIHVIGKDILKFHAIYWPAFLMAAGLEEKLPKTLVIHGHWLTKGTKMSKSLGNVIDPLTDCADRFGEDVLRWYLLRHGRLDADGDFQITDMINAYNMDLVNNLGNLMSRVNSPKLQIFPDNHAVNASVINATNERAERAKQHFNNYEFQNGLIEFIEAMNLCNRYVSNGRPWTLPDASEYRNTVKKAIYQFIPILEPIIPSSVRTIHDEQVLVKFPRISILE